MTRFRIAELRTGRARPFGPNGEPSAIDKAPRAGPVPAGHEGLDGDEQGDRRRHGGPDKALHAYPLAHYATWAADLPETAARFHPGAFGENLVIEGAVESDICLGDLWRIGGTLCEVSQSRQPCWKLNLRFGLPDMAYRVQQTGRSGWYFRVLEPGLIAAGDTAVLQDRPHSGWPLDRVARLLYHDALDTAALAELGSLPGLPESWQRLVAARLATGQIEDWSPRIKTPE